MIYFFVKIVSRLIADFQKKLTFQDIDRIFFYDNLIEKLKKIGLKSYLSLFYPVESSIFEGLYFLCWLLNDECFNLLFKADIGHFV